MEKPFPQCKFDAERKKFNKVQSIRSKILPTLLKALNLVLGLEGIFNVVKSIPTAFKLFGKTLKEYVSDTLEKVMQFIMVIAKAN